MNDGDFIGRNAIYGLQEGLMTIFSVRKMADMFSMVRNLKVMFTLLLITDCE